MSRPMPDLLDRCPRIVDLGDEPVQSPLPERLTRTIRDAAESSPVAVALGALPLLDRAAVAEFVDLLTDQAPARSRCLVCERRSGRRLLYRWGIPFRIAVFGSIGDALTAWSLRLEGYGEGWIPHRVGSGPGSLLR